MTLVVDVQYAVDEMMADDHVLPTPVDFERWAAAALAGRCSSGEMTIRVVGSAEGAALNEAYRQRRGPTNVLSFLCESTLEMDPPQMDPPLLGDLVICAPQVMFEAQQQHKTPQAHWAHMTVHGSLHLLGYDHEATQEAEIMERLEIAVLAELGYPDPYDEETVTPIAR